MLQVEEGEGGEGESVFRPSHFAPRTNEEARETKWWRTIFSVTLRGLENNNFTHFGLFSVFRRYSSNETNACTWLAGAGLPVSLSLSLSL